MNSGRQACPNYCMQKMPSAWHSRWNQDCLSSIIDWLNFVFRWNIRRKSLADGRNPFCGERLRAFFPNRSDAGAISWVFLGISQVGWGTAPASIRYDN
jgi:hypothetical protein